jgi:hypothetical protein
MRAVNRKGNAVESVNINIEYRQKDDGDTWWLVSIERDRIGEGSRTDLFDARRDALRALQSWIVDRLNSARL